MAGPVGSLAVNVGEMLVKKGKITDADLGEALAVKKSPQDRIDRILIKLGMVDERDVLEILGEQLSIPVIDLTETEIADLFGAVRVEPAWE